MELAWIKYGTERAVKYHLVLILGTFNGHTIALDQDAIDAHDMKVLKSAIPHIEGGDLRSRVGAVRYLCPQTYRKAFRKYSNDKLKVVQTFKV